MLVIFDTETTGVDHPADVVELASLVVKEGSPVRGFRSLAKPFCPIHPKASEVHGYRNSDLAHLPPASQVVQDWFALVEQAAEGEEIIFCGHNVIFDIKMVRQHVPQIMKHRTLCTKLMAQKLKPGSDNNKLTTLYDFFGLKTYREAHTALDDCKMTYDVLQKLLGLSSKSLEDWTAEQDHREVLEVITFGEKHKGKKFTEVLKIDPSFINFCYNKYNGSTKVGYTAGVLLGKF